VRRLGELVPILEKETLPSAKEANQYAEAEADEAKHGQELLQNGGEMAQLCY
jgi:hypothetical protein